MDKTAKIHIIYVIAILIAIIILLITIKWGEIPKLVELISFALTITSLVLAILAIVYAVYSNNSFSQNISKLDDASQKISESSNSLYSISTELNTKFEKIPVLLETIDKKTDTTQSMLNQLNEKALKNEDTKFIKSNSIDKENIRNIVFRTSVNGVLIMYALRLAKDINREINIDDLGRKCKIADDYMKGFIAPIESLGLIKIDSTYKESEFYWLITDMHDELYNNAINAVKEMWNSYKKEGESLQFVLDHINLVRIYFDLPPISKDQNFN